MEIMVLLLSEFLIVADVSVTHVSKETEFLPKPHH